MSETHIPLSLAMIVKDEVLTLERTVNSVRAYVDYVVIAVDKASSDGTRELANKLADTVITIDLDEELALKRPLDPNAPDRHYYGFGKARNQAIAVCPPDSWRLMLDGHENVVRPENLQGIIQRAVAAKCDGIELPLHFEPDQFGIPQLIFGFNRLTAPQVVYANPEHNVPQCTHALASKECIIEHRKQDQAVSARNARNVQRADANITGFKQKVEDNPKDSRSWFYLATAYKESSMWQEAIDSFNTYLDVSTWKEERWHARVNLGGCYGRINKLEEARNQFSLALEEFPVMAEAYYYLGDLAYKQKKYREAQVWLEKCISMPEPTVRLFLSPKIYRVDRYDLLSMIYAHTGQKLKSIETAKKALESMKHPRIEKNITIWEREIAAGT